MPGFAAAGGAHSMRWGACAACSRMVGKAACAWAAMKEQCRRSQWVAMNLIIQFMWTGDLQPAG
jgi:hypothetical protein